jgi:hypothetical protein
MISKRTVVLRALLEDGAVDRACRIAKVHHKTLHRWMKPDPEFAKKVELARRAGKTLWNGRS